MDNVSCDGDKTLCENIKDKTECKKEDSSLTEKDNMRRLNERHPDHYMSAVECLRLRNNLVEILEELKLRRMNDKENEEIMKRADEEKYELIRKCEAETQKLTEATKQHQKQLQDADRMCEEKLSRMEEQLKQHNVFKDCSEKEMNLLKNEIRNLEVVKYTLEKDVGEQKRKLKLHLQSSEQHLNQLTETGERFQSLHLQCKQLNEAQAQLEDSVQHAIKHNQALMYINEHQKCIVDEEKNHSLSLQAQLLEVKSLLQQKPDETSLQKYQQEITSLNQRLERVTTEKEKASEDIKQFESKYEKVTQILEDTNRLLVRQIENVEVHKKNSSQQALVIENLQKELAEVKGELQEVKAKKKSQTEQHKEEAKEWRQKNSQLQDDLNKIKEELAEQRTRCADLEDLNTTWSNQNIQLTEQLQSTKELLNKPKQEQFQQTSLSWMNMVEQESQTEVICADMSVQTYTIQQKTEGSQTQVPDLTVSATQTRNAALANSSSQTDRAVVHSVSVQAEIIKYNSKERLFSQSMSSPSCSFKILSQQSLASQTDVQSISNDHSECNTETVSGIACQPPQDMDLQSLSQPNSQSLSAVTCQSLSVTTSQSLPPDESQLQNVNNQHVLEVTSQFMTTDPTFSENATSQQVKENNADSIHISKEDKVQDSHLKHQNVAQRHSFQFSNTSNISNTVICSRKTVNECENRENPLISKNDKLVKDADDCSTVEDNGSEVTDELPSDMSKMEKDSENFSENLGKSHTDYRIDTQTKISTDHSQTTVVYCESFPSDHGNDRINKSARVDESSNAGITSPRSPGGSRLKLSLSRLRNSTTTCQTNPINSSQKSTPKPEGQEEVIESLKSNRNEDEPGCKSRESKGILKDVGQENDLKRKSVSFGSPLQDVREISQTSMESVSHDDGDKDLFLDSDDDSEEKCSKGGRCASEKCLPATTLIIGKTRVESTNSLASFVDEFLPDASSSKRVSTKAVNDDVGNDDDADLQMPATNTMSVNKEMKCEKSNTSTNSPCGNDQSTSKLLSRGKTGVCVPNRAILEIPSVTEMTLPPSALSNQYKRTIDAILNKGKKRKTDH